MRRLALLLPAIVLPCAGAELLDRVRSNFGHRLQQAEDSVCMMEIEREVFSDASDPWFDSRDRTRLEISVADGRELLSWEGEQPEDRPLTDFIGAGLGSTGRLTRRGRTVLTDDRTRIERPIRTAAQGLLQYRYQVPVEASRYVVMSAQGPLATAYEGDFWVDESTAQVVRIEVRIPHLPESVGVRRMISSVEYEEVEFDGLRGWFPARSEVEVESAQGPVARNRARFFGCRRRLASAPVGEKAARGEPWRIPEGLDFVAELRDSISSDRSWAGDRFTALVVKDAKQDGKVVLRKGDELRGRIVRLETVDTTTAAARTGDIRRMTAISLKLDEVRRQGRCAPIAATLKLVERLPVMTRVSPGGRAEVNAAAYSTNRAATYDTGPQMSTPGFGTFIVHGELYLVREGARMRWTTAGRGDAAGSSAPATCENR